LLLLAWATLFLCIGPARAATTTELALESLCGPAAVKHAQQVDAAARRYLLHPVHLVALMAVESHCQAHAVSRRGAIGLMQVMPYGPAANGLPRARLRDPRANIETGVRWLAMMTTWCGSLPAGIGAYNTGRCDRGKRFSRLVVSTVARVWREIERRREPRS
jgi:soluble lytic murein transglycosylase-like protein